MTTPIELSHVNIVSLVSVNGTFWLCNAETGERLQLPSGHWTLSFSQSGLGMLEQSLPGNEASDYWVNDLLNLSAHVVATREGASRTLLQPRVGQSFWQDDIRSESTLQRLSLPVSGPVQVVHLTLRCFRLPRSGCVHFAELPRICTFLFGTYPDGFIRKRLHRWRIKCESLGLESEHIRRSSEGYAACVRQGLVWLGEVPLEGEQSSSISLSALPMWLLALDSSAQDVAIAERGTARSPAQLLCHALLQTVLGDATWSCVLPARVGVLEFKGLHTNIQPCLRLPGQHWKGFKTVVQRLASEAGEVSAIQLMRGLVEVVQRQGATATVKLRCKEVLTLLVASCGRALDILVCAHVSSDLSLLPVTSGGQRALRMPTQYKDALLAESRGQNKRSFVRGMASSTAKRSRLLAPGVNEHMQNDRALEKYGNHYMSRYWLSLQCEGAKASSLTVAFDGVQCGGAERLTMVAHRNDSTSGFWLPAQVSYD
eukprot:6492505-Amphidinium_carterae.3